MAELLRLFSDYGLLGLVVGFVIYFLWKSRITIVYPRPKKTFPPFDRSK